MIEVENVSKNYGVQGIFTNSSFHIKENEVCVIIGRNGSGKSTLLQMILGLIPIKHGEIKIKGHPVKKSNRWKHFVSYLPEKFQLYPQLSVYENIEFFASLYKKGEEEVQSSLELTGILRARDKLVKDLSKGMLQRLGLSIAFLGDSEIILLDEPTSGIDPFGRKEIIDVITEMKRVGKTIIFSSHHLNEVKEVATHVIYVENQKAQKIKASEFFDKIKNIQVGIK